MRVYILSDVHIKFTHSNPKEQARHERILSFLKSLVGKADLLVLNGDIFDLWAEWRYGIIKQYFPALKLLADIVESGCKIVYVSGNHDFWFGDFFTQYLGAELHDRSYSFNADGKRILISHGDLFTLNDTRYKIFRRLVRSPLIRKLFSILHPDLALSLGNKLSRTSSVKRITKSSHKARVAGLELFAKKQITAGKYDYVVMGHSHNPVLIPIGNGFYANGGDWLRHNSFITIIDGKLELSQYQTD
jgi:UDP-2,3-diacylglucosamine hydrolase